MKERFLKFLKWFFIILGVLFFIQLILLTGIVEQFSAISEARPAFSLKTNNMEKMIDYIQNYRKENGSYPSDLEGYKTKKELKYKYETSNNNNCFTLELEEENMVKQYKSCMFSSENSSQNSESYSEHTK